MGYSRDLAILPVSSSAAKAWVNFNGTGTVAINDNFNVSSITDNGVGDYTVNFTTAFADTNYNPLACIHSLSSTNGTIHPLEYAIAVGSVSYRIQSTANSATGTYYDISGVYVVIFSN